jgi:hypothetical protein
MPARVRPVASIPVFGLVAGLAAATALAMPVERALAVSCPSFGSMRNAGTIRDPRLDELSAMQASLAHHGVLWSIEDAGNGPSLWAVNASGRLLARYRVRGAGVSNIDWEALALSRRSGADDLWIGDIGDNAHDRDGRSRPVPAFYRLSEPSISSSSGYRTGRLTARRFRFRYFDTTGARLGPRNAESLFADPRSNGLFLIQKDLETIDGTPDRARVFVLRPRRLRATIVNRANQVTSITGSGGGTAAGPVGADISRDGDWVVVKNYVDGWLWHRTSGRSVVRTFADEPTGPCSVPVDRAEGIAFGYGRSGRWRRFFSVEERMGGTPVLNVTPRS